MVRVQAARAPVVKEARAVKDIKADGLVTLGRGTRKCHRFAGERGVTIPSSHGA